MQGTTFPPYGSSGFQQVNRDFTGTITQADVADVFANVMHEDSVRGTPYEPTTAGNIVCGF